MKFSFEYRPSDSPLIDIIYRTESEGGGSFVSEAGFRNEIVFTWQKGTAHVSVRGPETKASVAPVPEDAEFLGIVFKLGTFMPVLPSRLLVDGGIQLPDVTRQSFQLHGSSWELPRFENADTFINRLVHDGVLAHEPMIESVLQDQPQAWSPRSIERRFVQATGVSQGMIRQIQRAQRAVALLQQGFSILDVVDQTGYFDQPHLTRSLRRFFGQTPAQILKLNASE
jgi:AraC-like DNA-binding protein